ncbi:hypothetical protein D3C85_1228850 [compost metagenome]
MAHLGLGVVDGAGVPGRPVGRLRIACLTTATGADRLDGEAGSGTGVKGTVCDYQGQVISGVAGDARTRDNQGGTVLAGGGKTRWQAPLIA